MIWKNVSVELATTRGAVGLHCTCLRLSGYGFLFPVPRFRSQERQRDVQPLTEFASRIVDRLPCGLCPEIQSVAGAFAFEALEDVLFEVSGEAA